MARMSLTAAFLLLLSLLAVVAHCRTLESEPATDASTAETTTLAVADEIGPPEAVVPAEQEYEQDGFLRLPSHRHHHPCRHGLFHRHLWWARHHDGLSLVGDGHHHRFHRRGDAEEPRLAAEAEEEVKAVAEPDPDRSLPDSEDADEAAAVKRWRMFRHGMRRHHHHHDADEEEVDHHEQEEQGTSAGVKRFRHHDEDDQEDEENEKKMRKMIHLHHHEEDAEEKIRKPLHFRHHDDDDEDEEMEEMIRHFRKAILRRRFHHGLRLFRHRHHHHHHAEEAAEQEGGVMTWIKGLMNRF